MQSKESNGLNIQTTAVNDSSAIIGVFLRLTENYSLFQSNRKFAFLFAMLLYAYINGKIFPAEQAVLSVTDLGLLRGYAVFDFLRTRHHHPFLLNDYLDRFSNSAKGLHLKLPMSKNKIAELIHSLLKWGDLKEDVGIRLILTGGNAQDSITVSKPNFIILVEDLNPSPEKYYTQGVKLITNKFQRYIPQIKSTNYTNTILHQEETKAKNTYDILYCHNGKILETSRNNFFIFIGNTLITPQKNVLPGITRKFILSIAKNIFEVEERELDLQELREATEAFTSGTTREIVPVVQIDQLKIGNGKVGKNTKKLMKAFEEKQNELLK